MNESQSYQKMLQEMEDILQQMNTPNLDLDQMVAKVERGYELIQSMRERLDRTKDKIELLHRKYDEPAATN